MTQHNLTQILKVIRDLVMRNRPCYRDYLGSETVTKTVQISSGAFASSKGFVTAEFPATDPTFTGFILGETYTVTIDGVTADYVARNFSPLSDEFGPIIGTATTFNMEDNTFDGWLAAAVIDIDSVLCAAQTLDTSFVGKTISISQTKTETVTHYKTKLLPEYLLPAFLRKNVVATKTEVQNAVANAVAAADNAQNTALAAHNAANGAQVMASAAQSTASAAQSTANTAKNTADNAKIAADAALPKTGGTVSGTVNFRDDGTSTTRFMTAINVGTNGSLKAGSYSAVMLNKAGPLFFTNGESLEVGYRSIGSSGSHMRASFLTEVATLSLTSNRSGLSTTFCGDGRIAYDGDIKFNLSRGIIIKSSTADSTKLFRITVDDTGTLKATEVTS